MLNNTPLILSFILLIAFSCSKTEPIGKPNTPTLNIDFVKTLGGSLNERGESIINTNDEGYAILGYAQSNDGDLINKPDNSFDYWLLKFDKNHNLEWQRTYGGSDDDRGAHFIQTNDNGYALIGYSKSNDRDLTENNGANDFWVCKLNVSGDILWKKSFGFLGADNGNAIIQTQDNGFLITGVLDVSASNGQGNSKATGTKRHAGGDYWAIKLSNSGEKQWSKFFGGTFTDTPFDVIQTKDKGYILIGSSDSEDVDIQDNKGSYDFWVINISETGMLLWEKSFGGSQIDEAHAICDSGDGNYLIVGDTRSNDFDVSSNNGAADLWLIKMSPEGDLIWEQNYGGVSFDAGRSISKTQDGNFLISGSSRSLDGDLSENKGQNDAWLLKINPEGTLLWHKTIGGSNIDFAYDAIELNDKSIITIGESSSNDGDISTNKGFSDLLIIKTK
ncbi:hypothetical protein [uncultured Algibacter sp.]|uniref:hypothetical protein n=1 Tax=uncultured Algibacter sp. TaxID=298659 RepID=UPI0026268252|nr:hypothetical protein [uncultured Algibacter sp.]